MYFLAGYVVLHRANYNYRLEILIDRTQPNFLSHEDTITVRNTSLRFNFNTGHEFNYAYKQVEPNFSLDIDESGYTPSQNLLADSQ